MRLEEYRTLKKEHRKPHLASRSEAEIPFMLDHTHIFHFHSTFDIIRATESGNLSDKIMFTIHPQRLDKSTESLDEGASLAEYKECCEKCY